MTRLSFVTIIFLKFKSTGVTHLSFLSNIPTRSTNSWKGSDFKLLVFSFKNKVVAVGNWYSNKYFK